MVDYITQAQKHGLAEFEIKQNLLNAGWEASAVEENFVFAKASENRPVSMGQNEPSRQAISENHKSSILPMQNTGPLNGQPAVKPAVQLVNSNIAISENTFQSNTGKGNFLKNKFLWIGFAVILLLGGTAYGYFSFFYVTPARVMDAYLKTKPPLASKTSYEVSYSLNLQSGDSSSTNPIILTMSGDGYTNLASSTNLESSSNIKFSYSFGSGSVSTGLKYVLLNNILYLFIGDIKKSLGATDEYADWLKLDLSQTQKTLTENSDKNSTSSPFNNKALMNKIAGIVQKAQIIKTSNYLAKEQVSGINTYHIQEQLDTAALNKAASDIIDAVQSDPSFTGTKITADQKNILSALIRKFQVKNFDLWIGQKDHLLYKTHIVTNFPSFSDFEKSSLMDSTFLGSAKEKSREAKRLADVRQMSTALELFYNDHGGYPEGVTGVPQNISPNYIGVWPQAPSPSDGTCTDYFNTYWYRSEGAPKIVNGIKLYQSYTLTFCLGGTVGGYKAGIAKLTEKGIEDNINCPATPDLCIGSRAKVSDQDILDAINKISFSDEIKIDITYSDYGKVEKLEPPQNSQDLQELFNQFSGSLSSFNQASIKPMALQTSLFISALAKIGSRN